MNEHGKAKALKCLVQTVWALKSRYEIVYLYLHTRSKEKEVPLLE